MELKLIEDSKATTVSGTDFSAKDSTKDENSAKISSGDIQKKVTEIMATKTPRTNKSLFTEEFANSLTMFPKSGQVAPATKNWSQYKTGAGTEFWSYKAMGSKYNEQVELELEADF